MLDFIARYFSNPESILYGNYITDPEIIQHLVSPNYFAVQLSDQPFGKVY